MDLVTWEGKSTFYFPLGHKRRFQFTYYHSSVPVYKYFLFSPMTFFLWFFYISQTVLARFSNFQIRFPNGRSQWQMSSFFRKMQGDNLPTYEKSKQNPRYEHSGRLPISAQTNLHPDWHISQSDMIIFTNLIFAASFSLGLNVRQFTRLHGSCWNHLNDKMHWQRQYQRNRCN